ncbi:TPA: hypothetical protein ACH3X1_016572 [Trebouxia sp. C0004]
MFRLSRLPVSPPSSVTMHTTPESESDEEAEPLHEADAGGQNGNSTDGDYEEDNHLAVGGPLPSLQRSPADNATRPTKRKRRRARAVLLCKTGSQHACATAYFSFIRKKVCCIPSYSKRKAKTPITLNKA